MTTKIRATTSISGMRPSLQHSVQISHPPSCRWGDKEAYSRDTECLLFSPDSRTRNWMTQSAAIAPMISGMVKK